MKTAVLSCNDFVVLGGAERHILDLATALDADIVCPRYDPEIIRNYDPAGKIRIISLGKALPPEPRRQFEGMRLFKHLDIGYDFVICMDDMAVRYLVHDIPHLYYVLSPRRAFYDMYYPTLETYHGVHRWFYWGVLNTFKAVDRRFVRKHVRNFAANSHNVRNRIYKTYLRDASVLYAPVHTNRYRYEPSEGYWLSVGRVDKWKRVELQVEAFRQMPEKKLIVAGPVYPAYSWLRESAPPNVTFLGPVGEDRLIDLYSRCEGFITTAIDEDFGLTPVEAMASGKPVVAAKEGGYMETVIDGHTGLLVSPILPEIIHAVRMVGADPDKYRDECLRQARRFDFEVFADEARRIVTGIYKADKVWVS